MEDDAVEVGYSLIDVDGGGPGGWRTRSAFGGGDGTWLQGSNTPYPENRSVRTDWISTFW